MSSLVFGAIEMRPALDAQKSTYPTEIEVALFLLPKDIAELGHILKVCRETAQRVHVFSVGRNWGYGSKLPHDSGIVVVSLEKMNKIRWHSRDFGIVEIEPGVTFEQLQTFLTECMPEFYISSPGSGPLGSVLGNLLDRGLTLGLDSDRPGALLQVEALLGSGEIITTGSGDSRMQRIAGTSVGPDLARIFIQSSLGIVTGAAISVELRPAAMSTFYRYEPDTSSAASRVRQLLSARSSAFGVTLGRTKDRLSYFSIVIGADSLAHLGVMEGLVSGVIGDGSFSHEDWTRHSFQGLEVLGVDLPGPDFDANERDVGVLFVTFTALLEDSTVGKVVDIFDNTVLPLLPQSHLSVRALDRRLLRVMFYLIHTKSSVPSVAALNAAEVAILGLVEQEGWVVCRPSTRSPQVLSQGIRTTIEDIKRSFDPNSILSIGQTR